LVGPLNKRDAVICFLVDHCHGVEDELNLCSRVVGVRIDVVSNDSVRPQVSATSPHQASSFWPFLEALIAWHELDVTLIGVVRPVGLVLLAEQIYWLCSVWHRNCQCAEANH